MSGHSVLVVPVPELEPFVRARTAHYDPSFLSEDPMFVHAHVTVLGPFVPRPTPAVLDAVEDVLAGFEPFAMELTEVTSFPDGLIYLRPDPDEPIRAMTAAMVRAFPDYPPYAGQFPDPSPHLTLDRSAPGIDVAWVEAQISSLLPVRLRVDHIDLQWWDNHDCHLMASWKLGEER